jgi:hypothetical protein
MRRNCPIGVPTDADTDDRGWQTKYIPFSATRARLAEYRL